MAIEEGSFLAEPRTELRAVEEPDATILDEAPKPRRLRRVIAAGFAGAVVLGGLGMALTPAHARIGPHDSDIWMTVDGTGELDLGPIGTVSEPLPLHGFGVQVELRGRSSGVPSATSQSNATANINEYVQMLNDPELDKARIKNALINHAWGVSTAGFLIGMGMGELFYTYADRKKVKAHVKRVGNKWTYGVLALGLVATPVTVMAHGQANAPSSQGNLGTEFKGTALEHVTINNSPLLDGFHWYGEMLSESEHYKQRAIKSIDTLTQNSTLLMPTENTIVAMVSEGMKCNETTAKVTRELEKKLRPSVSLNAGDIASTGTALDERCIDSLSFGVESTEIGAAGNHDDEAAVRYMQKNGFKMLSGKPVTTAGLKILGDSTPTVSVLLNGKRSREGKDGLTTELVGDKLKETACRSGVDVMLVNEPNMAVATTGSGCARLVIAGVLDTTRLDNIKNASGVATPYLQISSSSGANDDGEFNLGAPHNTGHFATVEFDKLTHTPTRYQIFNIAPDGNVTADFPRPIS